MQFAAALEGAVVAVVVVAAAVAELAGAEKGLAVVKFQGAASPVAFFLLAGVAVVRVADAYIAFVLAAAAVAAVVAAGKASPVDVLAGFVLQFVVAKRPVRFPGEVPRMGLDSSQID